jgi:folate-binding protein YgfZ
MSSVTPHNAAELSSGPAHAGTSSPGIGKVRDEFRALTSTCGVYHLSTRTKVEITGNDRIRWLNGMVTNNIRDLAVGQGVYSFLLNPQGHILGDFFVYNRGDRLVVDTEQAQIEKIIATFDHYIIMDDVEVTRVDEKLAAIGIAGPSAKETLKVAGIEAGGLKSLHIEDLVWRGANLSVVRGEWEQYPSYEIWSPPKQVSVVTAELQSAGAAAVGHEALELYRIALGIPRYGQDVRERDLPQETEQQRALNFNKGCYVGQEIVERIRSRGNVHRKFAGFRIAGPAPTSGAKIQVQGKDVGEITSSGVIPAVPGEQTAALGYIRREAALPGKEIQIAGSSATVSDLPFADLLTN